MINTLLHLLGKIDDVTIQICERMSFWSDKMGIPFIVIGATARDLILTYGYNVPAMRMTQDIDFGIQVPTWEQYDMLKKQLLASDDFTGDRLPHRLIYKKIRPVDLVPFGPLADKKSFINWPSDQTRMSVLGFEEAYQHKLWVRIRSDPVLDIPFSSLTSLVILKFISWNDNPVRRSKDAEDIELIVRSYLDAGNQLRFFDEHADLINEEGLDIERASARLLGRDISKMALPITRAILEKILDQEINKEDQSRLVLDMMKSSLKRMDDNYFENTRQLLQDLKKGIADQF